MVNGAAKSGKSSGMVRYIRTPIARHKKRWTMRPQPDLSEHRPSGAWDLMCDDLSVPPRPFFLFSASDDISVFMKSFIPGRCRFLGVSGGLHLFFLHHVMIPGFCFQKQIEKQHLAMTSFTSNEYEGRGISENFRATEGKKTCWVEPRLSSLPNRMMRFFWSSF